MSLNTSQDIDIVTFESLISPWQDWVSIYLPPTELCLHSTNQFGQSMCPGNSALGAATLKPYLIGYNSCKESLYEQSENSRNTEDKVVGHWRKAKRKLHISLFKLETRLQFQNVCLNRIDQLFFFLLQEIKWDWFQIENRIFARPFCWNEQSKICESIQRGRGLMSISPKWSVQYH